MKKLLSFILFTLITTPAWAQFDDEEPPPADQVFKGRAFSVDANTIRAEWAILDGYYLYKDKFKFKSLTDGVTLGTPSFPKGKIKEDEFFGKVESYRKTVAVDIPITRTAGASYEMVLETVSQGCADIGLCYPPQTVKMNLSLLAKDETVAPAKSAGTVSLLSSLSSSLGLGSSAQEEFLEPDKAFIFNLDAIDGNTVLAHWDIADGYYLYKDKFRFEIVQGEGIKLGKPSLPKGKEKDDEFFGVMEVYYHEAQIKLPLLRTNTGKTEVEIKADFQGCADAGFCYPPMTKTMLLSLPEGSEGVAELASTATDSAGLSEQDTIARTLRDSSVLWVILSFFGFGLLLSFTPCVFPMIPILSSIIAGQGDSLTTRKAFSMSLVYVLAMALTYTVAGVVAGMFGQNLQAAFQNPWILGTFSLVFVALAFSMFGFYDLQLPSKWQSKLTEISNSQKGGTLVGVGIMGFLSALIVGPCVAAPLAGALIYIGQTGDAVLGGIALFALSLGMGAPLLAIGTSAGKLLPRAGAWMEAVKAFFGVMLIAVAIWMLERIIPPAVTMFLWAMLLILSAIYMGALTHLQINATGWSKLWKGIGVAMLIYGGLMLIGVASNSTDPLQPLRGVSLGAGSGAASAAPVMDKLAFRKIKSLEDLDREIRAANSAGKPVMLDFYADWCVSCKEMERYTFSQAGVQAALNQGILLKADVTANDEIDKALMKSFGIIGPPSILFFDASGKELRNMRLVGFLEANRFQGHVEKAFNL
ncbi:MAG: protein-disulfide reductase DsbD [Gammaproteobacteria bacterium]|nr:protein-disulfide reductase DsbD [Gammaproteobacteria bacterium]